MSYCPSIGQNSSARYNRLFKKRQTHRDDIEPDEPEGDGRTPLSGVSSDGNEVVVKPPIARGDVSPDKPNNRD